MIFRKELAEAIMRGEKTATRAYGVSAPTISAIKHRQIWAEV